MPLEMLDLVFARTDEYLRERPNEIVEIIWHGGEPLLLGPEYFRAAITRLSERCRDTRGRVHHSIQTNLTRFTPEYRDIFKALGIAAVGTSYDPLPNMRGPAQGKEYRWYSQQFMKGLEALEECGLGWGMIYVVTRSSLAAPLGLFHSLVNFCAEGGINFNPVLIYDEERRHIAITAAEFKEFLGKIFPCWWEKRHRFPHVEPFSSYVRTIIEDSLSLGCVDSGSCTFNQVNIAPDGQTSQCGRSSDWGLLSYGNIADKTLAGILRDPQREQFVDRLTKLHGDDCSGCRFWAMCHGGCPLDAYAAHKSFMHKSEWCESKRGFIEEYFEPITGVRYHGQE
jgi:radical SAM protein with 4Fe4S-binding SPASM domain